VDRIGGRDRYDTAVLIAQEILDAWGDGFHNIVFVARGDRFPDALSVSPAAFWLEAPVLLVAPDALPAQTVEVIDDLSDPQVLIAGGKSAVNSHVAKGISVAAGDAQRVSGNNRYETAVELSEHFVAQGWSDWSYTALATGEDFADALTGGPATGTHQGVMLLTLGGSLSPETSAALTDHKAEIGKLVVLGGGAAISAPTMAAAKAIVD
jgi:putative cell wall-binding protein